MYNIYSEKSVKGFQGSTLDTHYKDIDVSFKKNPINDDIMVVSGVDSIKQALQNLVLLNHYEKPFHEYIGSDIYKTLFENSEPALNLYIKDKIRGLIDQYEPRVATQSIEVLDRSDNNHLHIRITVKILETLEIVSLNFFLQIDR